MRDIKNKPLAISVAISALSAVGGVLAVVGISLEKAPDLFGLSSEKSGEFAFALMALVVLFSAGILAMATRIRRVRGIRTIFLAVLFGSFVSAWGFSALYLYFVSSSGGAPIEMIKIIQGIPWWFYLGVVLVAVIPSIIWFFVKPTDEIFRD